MNKGTRGRRRQASESELIRGLRSGVRNGDVDNYIVGRMLGEIVVSRVRVDGLKLPVTFTLMSARGNGVVVGKLQGFEDDLIVTLAQEPLAGELVGVIVDSRGNARELKIIRLGDGTPAVLRPIAVDELVTDEAI